MWSKEIFDDGIRWNWQVISHLNLYMGHTCKSFINADIIRVGSRSKNEALEECNLRKQRGWKSKQLHRAHLELRAKREKFIVSSATFHSQTDIIWVWYILYWKIPHSGAMKVRFSDNRLHIKQSELAFDMCFFLISHLHLKLINAFQLWIAFLCPS